MVPRVVGVEILQEPLYSALVGEVGREEVSKKEPVACVDPCDGPTARVDHMVVKDEVDPRGAAMTRVQLLMSLGVSLELEGVEAHYVSKSAAPTPTGMSRSRRVTRS